MSNPIPFIMQGTNIMLMVNNQSYTINDDHMNYARIMDALSEQDWDKVASLVDVNKAMSDYTNGSLEIINGVLFWEGNEFHNALADRILEMYKQGFPVDAMISFMGNLMKNPSFRAVNELYGFLEKNMLPITPDGCFLAYKKVKEDEDGKFVDIHTGKFDNSVGTVVEMARNAVNDNAEVTCSDGLHFASLSYMPHFGSGCGPIIILKINPADVVSIPVDYNNSKGRCCKYEVIGVHGKSQDEEAFDSVVVDATDTAAFDDYQVEQHGAHGIGIGGEGDDNWSNPNDPKPTGPSNTVG